MARSERRPTCWATGALEGVYGAGAAAAGDVEAEWESPSESPPSEGAAASDASLSASDSLSESDSLGSSSRNGLSAMDECSRRARGVGPNDPLHRRLAQFHAVWRCWTAARAEPTNTATIHHFSSR